MNIRKKYKNTDKILNTVEALMILNYQQCIELYGNDYGIRKLINENKLFKIEKGLYSDEEYYPYIAVIKKKYPNAILTLDSALYYHSLTDVIPNKYYLATSKDAYKIKDKNVKQYFCKDEYLDYGKETIVVHDIDVNIYNKERLLIEVIRYKNKLPYDYYKEIIHSYRNIINDLDIQQIEEYAIILPKSKMVIETLRTEVF